MTIKQLTQFVDLAETHRQIVGPYEGHYSLGVTDNPPSFVLRVDATDTNQFPTSVKIAGESIPVVVKGSFAQPRPLQARA